MGILLLYLRLRCFFGRHQPLIQYSLGTLVVHTCSLCDHVDHIIETGTNLRYASFDQYNDERSYE